MAEGGRERPAEREYDVFISYQRDTADKAKKLADALRQNQRDVFIDLKLSSDAKWRADIERRLGRARCVVAIWSKRASTSGWVNYEAFRAQQEGKLVAVTFDPIKPDELPGWLTDQQITSLRDWRDIDQLHDGWLSVRRAVHAKCGKLPDYRFKGWLGGGAAHERVTSLAFHPTEDARLLSAGSEGSAALWLASAANLDWRGKSVSNGERSNNDWTRHGQIARFSAPPSQREHQHNSVWHSQYSRDGERIVVACRDGFARVLDRNLSSLLLELNHNDVCGAPLMGFANHSGGQHKDGVFDAAFTSDGTVVTVGGSKALFWSAQGQLKAKPTAMPEGASAMLVRILYCDAANALVVGDKLGKVRLLNPATGQIDGEIIADRADTTVHLALGPSISESKAVQGVLAIVSQSALDSMIKFQTWATLPQGGGAFSPERENGIRIETAPIRSIALHPNAPVVAVASNAVQPKIFDYEHREPLPLGRTTDTLGWHDSATSAVAFSAEGKYLAVGSDDGRISIWETRAHAFSSGATERNRRAEDRK